MARRGRHPPTPEADESPQWHMGAPMMPDHAKELARVVALWSRLEHMRNRAGMLMLRKKTSPKFSPIPDNWLTARRGTFHAGRLKPPPGWSIEAAYGPDGIEFVL